MANPLTSSGLTSPAHAAPVAADAGPTLAAGPFCRGDPASIAAPNRDSHPGLDMIGPAPLRGPTSSPGRTRHLRQVVGHDPPPDPSPEAPLAPVPASPQPVVPLQRVDPP